MDGGRTLSPSELSQELQIPLSNTNYHVTELAKAGLIELARQRQVRGATEHFYRIPARRRHRANESDRRGEAGSPRPRPESSFGSARVWRVTVRDRRNHLIAGATGFVGGRLATVLAEAGAPVRCLLRDGSKAGALEAAGMDVPCRGRDRGGDPRRRGTGRRGRLSTWCTRWRAAAIRRAGAGGRSQLRPRRQARRRRAASSTSAGSATRASPSTCAAATRPRASSPPRGRRSPTSGRRWSSAPAASPTGLCATSSAACRS